jgi:hypothetical protein
MNIDGMTLCEREAREEGAQSRRYARQVDRRPERMDAPRTGRSVRADAGGDGVPDRAALQGIFTGRRIRDAPARPWPGICKIPVEDSLNDTGEHAQSLRSSAGGWS